MGKVIGYTEKTVWAPKEITPLMFPAFLWIIFGSMLSWALNSSFNELSALAYTGSTIYPLHVLGLRIAPVIIMGSVVIAILYLVNEVFNFEKVRVINDG